MKPVYVIYGAGGHALVVADLVRVGGGQVAAFFDDQPQAMSGATVMPYTADHCEHARLIIGIGNNRVRQKLAEKVKHTFATLIHPSAYVAPDAEVGAGTVILANAVVQAKAKIGNHVIINAGVCVDHEAVLHDFVTVYPQAYIGGGAILETGVLVNPGAVILRASRVAAGTEIPPLDVFR